MKPLKQKDISKLTAEKLNLDIDMVDDLITEYYKYVQKKLSSAKHLKINITGLGVFSVRLGRVKNQIKVKEKVVNMLTQRVKLSLSRYETLHTAKEDLENLKNLQELLELEIDKKKEFKENRDAK